MGYETLELKDKYKAWLQAEAAEDEDECSHAPGKFTASHWEWLEDRELDVRRNHYALCMHEVLSSPRWNLGTSAGRGVVEATLCCIDYLKTSEGKQKTKKLFELCPSMMGSTAGGSAWALCDAGGVMDALSKNGLLYDAVCDRKGVLYALGGLASRKLREGRRG